MSATRNTTFKKPSYGTNEWCREVSAPSSWEKEVKHEALRGSGSAFLYYFLCKRTKKSLCVLLSGIIPQRTAPSPDRKYFLKAALLPLLFTK